MKNITEEEVKPWDYRLYCVGSKKWIVSVTTPVSSFMDGRLTIELTSEEVLELKAHRDWLGLFANDVRENQKNYDHRVMELDIVAEYKKQKN